MRNGRLIALVLFVVAAVVAGCSEESNPPDPTIGDWQGAIELPGQPLPVGVTFKEDGTATVDIPLQGVSGAPLKDVKSGRDGVEWAMADIPGDPKFKGRYDSGSDKITGDFSQAGQTFPLSLQRGKVAQLNRPQEPKPPFLYKSEDVSYRNGELTIAGTLTKPQGDGPFPAVLLITGSGPQDRNEELMGHKPFLLLADTLTRAGYAVLRTDDRGVGGTGGKLDDANYDDLAADAAAGVNFLRGRAEIDKARVGLLGHSEGGYLAPQVAARPDSGVAFVILMAGPAVTGRDVLIEQNRVLLAAAGETPEAIETQVQFVSEWSRLLSAGDLAGAKAVQQRHNETLPVEQRQSEAALDAVNTRYMGAFLGYDPGPDLSALRIPVFAFFGDKDLQVPPSQSEQPMRDRLAANPDATVQTFPGLNHLMQPAPTGQPSEYTTIETTIAPEVLTSITSWLTQRFPPK
ncbi:S9 family peptidase [Nocardia sp. XZ_19_385]|uniref:alpha/beta hydrolase family protein n=1 Tax=Nocardia sp. XZ_19_385 TaxID=2769488 RepID=UPI00188E6982|nr:alpha/beta hydrolase [Nocardia sp. XZ_19_385]